VIKLSIFPDGYKHLVADLKAANIYGALDHANEDCRKELALFLFRAVSVPLAIREYSEVLVAHVNRIMPEFQGFCGEFKQLLTSLVGEERVRVSWFCHNIPEDMNALRTAQKTVEHAKPKSLQVRSQHVFEDSITVLTDTFIDTEQPGVIEIDGTRMTRQDWITEATLEGWKETFVNDIDGEVSVGTDRPVAHYAAFGRLMGFSIRHALFPKLKFPPRFFEEFLGIEEEEPLVPEEILKAMQGGFEYVYEINNFRKMEAANFEKLFT
jgi:hypothetical protein